MVDAAVSKTAEHSSCGFESHLRYQRRPRLAAVFFWAAALLTAGLVAPRPTSAADTTPRDKKPEKSADPRPNGEQEATTFDAELRFRGSQARNLRSLQASQEDLLRGVFQRIRAGIHHRRGPLTATIQIQTAGAMGAPVQFDPDNLSGALPVPVGLQQGFVRWSPDGIKGLELQLGRMELSYGAERRIGRYDFHESGNAFDGLRVGYAPIDVLAVEVLAVKLRRNTAQPEQERHLLGAYVTARLAEIVTTDLYFLYLDDGDDDLRANHMNMGVRLVLKPLYFVELDAEAAVQFGDLVPKGYQKPIDHLATSFAAELRTRGTIGIPLGLALRVQRHSGDTDPSDDVSEGWRQLYPSLAQQVGLLQLFPQSNLLQYGGGLRIGPEDHAHLLVDARFNSAMSGSVVPAFNQPTLGGDDTWAALGTELDVQVHVPLLDNAKLMLATAFFAPSQLLADEVGEQWAQQFLAQVTATF